MPTQSPHPVFYRSFHDPTSSPSPVYYPTQHDLQFYNHHSSHSSSPTKRLKLHQDFNSGLNAYSQPIDYSFNHYPVAMSQAVPRVQPAPHISLQRASESASPDTSISSVSNHSTPSPSPSRVTIMSDHGPPDLELYDENYRMAEEQPKQQHLSFRRLQSSAQSPSYSTFNGNPASASHQQEYNYSSSHPVPELSKNYVHSSVPDYSNSELQTPMHVPTHPSDDEEPPALSPCRNPSQSSRPSVSDASFHSPATPTYRSEGGRPQPPHPIAREDSRDSVDKWIEECLRDAEHTKSTLPSLNRTVSDAKQDELFNPDILPGTTHTQPRIESPRSLHFQNVFQQAQNQHAMAKSAPKPSTIRDHSPFRANSPFHPGLGKEKPVPSPTRATALLPVAYPSVRSLREQEKEREAEALQAQMKKEYDELAHPQSPKTISPKDAYVEYVEPEGEGIKGSLFAPHDSAGDDMDHSSSYQSSSHGGDDDKSENSFAGLKAENSFGLKTEDSFASMATSRQDSDVGIDYGLPMFNGSSQPSSQQFDGHLGVPSYSWAADGSSPQASSMPSSQPYSSQPQSHSPQNSPEEAEADADDYDYQPGRMPKPDSKANSGAYSCTIHGCNQRFPTAGQMSKHRREAHRHATPLGSRDMTVRSQHQGPHRCTRINPSTNKPCNTVFSRPYDLTRHEDTIHNTRRLKVRCEICNDEKTFSRQDALTRHKKVKHGIDK